LTRSSHEFLSAPLVPSSALGLPSGCVRRMFLLYVPSGHSASRRSSLVVLNPDIGRSPMDKLVQEVFTVAERLNSLLVVLDVVRHAFNVGADAQASGEDDVAYALAALRKVAEAVFVDVRRVYCTGYSRGGRFCAQLASELPALFAAIAPVASLRYPHPNNATRPISVIAFHGTSDPINPCALERRGVAPVQRTCTRATRANVPRAPAPAHTSPLNQPSLRPLRTRPARGAKVRWGRLAVLEDERFCRVRGLGRLRQLHDARDRARGAGRRRATERWLR